MKKILAVVFCGILFCLFFLAVFFYLKKSPFPAIRISNNAKYYTVSYRPTIEFNNFLGNLKISQQNQVFGSLFNHPVIKLSFIDYENTSNPRTFNDIQNPIKVSSLIEQPSTYSLNFSIDNKLWTVKHQLSIENMLLTAIIIQLLGLENPKETKLAISNDAIKVLSNFKKVGTNPIKITVHTL